MVDLYTSYETSIALRDAGAPQEDGEKVWYFSETYGQPRLVNDYMSDQRPDPMNPARAFRADELIEALHASGLVFSVYNPAPDWTDSLAVWRVTGFVKGKDAERFEHASLIEALAAAWLAILKEGK